MRLDSVGLALLVGGCLAVAPSTRSFAALLTFTDRAAWEASVGAFTEETFDSFTADQSFNNGASVDVGDFTLTGFGDATLGATVFNFIDAAPFDPSRPSPSGTTDLVVRVVDANFNFPPSPPGPVGFDIVFDRPQRAWGADFGTTGSALRVNVDGVEAGLAVDDGFFGFVDTAGTFTTIRIDTPLDAGGAVSTADRFVYAEPVPEPAALLLLALGAVGVGACGRRRGAD